MEEELKEGRYRQAKTLGEMLETDDDRVLFAWTRKLWRPSKTSKTLVVSIPPLLDFNEGDYVKVNVTAKKRIIIELPPREHEG